MDHKNDLDQGMIAFRQLIFGSEEFHFEVAKIRETYSIRNSDSFRKSKKYKALKANTSSRTMDGFNKQYQSLNLTFNKDVACLCRHFFVSNLFYEIKMYVLNKDFGRWSWRNPIRIIDNKITVDVEWDVTEGEWKKVWRNIQGLKKQFGHRKIKLNKDFDEKLWLLRKDLGIIQEIPKNKVRKTISDSQKNKWVKEAREWQKSILSIEK